MRNVSASGLSVPIGKYGDRTMKAMKNVNRRGRVKKPQIGHNAKENKQNERSPSTITVGAEDGVNTSDFSSNLLMLHEERVIYKITAIFKRVNNSPRYNGVLLIRSSFKRRDIRLDFLSPK